MFKLRIENSNESNCLEKNHNSICKMKMQFFISKYMYSTLSQFKI